MTSAGDLRDRVGFYKRGTTGDPDASPPTFDDGYGNTVGEFSATAEFSVAANIKPRLGGEAVLAGRLTGQNLVNITVRQSDDTSSITTDWRAKNERSGELYNIRSIIDPDENTAQHGRFWEMLCEKGVAT